ncbi:hypothetical protein AJ79_01896 [Helicocarpus griseus UAMH5409]|uniref:Glycoprotease family protein n=1 Tax=Helicocarpus griseus UAMH5409 TaxID=1447875 RepID=A0A2B7Y4R5_9EURO|nr:hypothetical protein AJ79_01896 [Helicocarpus griseus UAMH5409]
MNNNTAQYEVPSPHDQSDVLPSSFLRVQTIPTFPLSSPIREEVTTPFESPGRSQLAQPEKDDLFASPEDHFVQETHHGSNNSMHIDNQLEDRQKLLGETLQAPRPSRWDSIKRPGRTIMKRNAKEPSTNKKKRPGLNLVTNFSNDTKFKRDAASKRRQSFSRGFIDLNDLRSLSKEKETANSKQEHRLMPPGRKASKGYGELKDDVAEAGRGLHAKSRFKQTRKSPLDALRASPSKTQDLSPSDRPIMIGISVPYDNASNSKRTKKLANNTTPTKSLRSPNSSDTTPVTPAIIITPARDQDPWDSFTGGLEPHHARPASSIYSQPTPRAKDSRPESIIPPVPAIPTSHSFTTAVEPGDVFADRVSTPTRRHRAFSTGTVFEDDLHTYRRVSRQRSFSNESKLETPGRCSIDTIATRRRSHGWWNYLLSPLLSRSNTISSKMSFRSPQDETPPAMPPFPTLYSLQVGDKSREKQIEDEVSFFSPDTPYSGEEKDKAWGSPTATVGKPNGQRQGFNTDTDDDDWEDDCSQATSPQSRNKTSPMSPVSTHSIPLVISSPNSAGYAQEYFHQRIHDHFNRNRGTEGVLGRSPDITVFPPVPEESTVIYNQNPNNPFFQQFVDSVRGGEETRERSNSDSTVIEDEPDFSPNVRQATATPLLRAAPVGPFQTSPAAPTRSFPQQEVPSKPSSLPPRHAVQKMSDSPNLSEGTSSTRPPPYCPPKKITKARQYRAILPSDLQPQPQSPGPISPAAQTQMTSRGGIPMSSMQQIQRPIPTYRATNDPSERGTLPLHLHNQPVHISDFERPWTVRAHNESRRQRLEREDQMARKVGGLWRGRGCFSNRGCFGRPGREGRKRRRWYLAIAIVLIMIIIASVVLAVTLTRKRDNPPEQSRWLNLTGYPPMPTGVSTIAGPNSAVTNSGCIHPKSMWSCSLPKENHEANKPFDPDQPNFRLQISFRNGSFAHSTIPTNSTATKRSTLPLLGGWSSVPQVVRARSLQARGEFTPIPPPPSIKEQEFLGNTTDGVHAPFAGEDTPFFATFLSPEPVTITTRQRRANTSGNDQPADLASVIPEPSRNPDGTAAAANLLPLPISQPIHLYDRGLPSEHYGFYTYYDRSIFLKSDIPINGTDTGVTPDDENGGSPRSAARVRCTWTQTRFLVQIWTQTSQNKMDLLPRPSATESSSATVTASATLSNSDSGKNIIPLSATDFTRPGSFPYPITITVDRHGGNPKKKMAYCYELDLQQRYIVDSKQLQLENKGFGGKLINPGFLFNGNSPEGEEGIGKRAFGEQVEWAVGFDGGDGGCSCQWRNWLTTR